MNNLRKLKAKSIPASAFLRFISVTSLVLYLTSFFNDVPQHVRKGWKTAHQVVTEATPGQCGAHAFNSRPGEAEVCPVHLLSSRLARTA